MGANLERTVVSATTEVSSVSPPSLSGRLRRLVEYRELLANLVRKELRSRYKDSTLGFLWSMLHPIMYLVVFWVVFTIILPGGPPDFPAFLLSGLLPWTLFSASLAGGTVSVVGNGALLKKVYFPREVLPLASIGAALFHFMLQMLVLVAFLALSRHPFVSRYLVLVPVAIAVEVLLAAGLSLLLASLNVYMRDVQHLLELVLLAWFWMTPIVYPVALVAGRMKEFLWLYLLNPMTIVVLSFQRAFYNQVTPTDPNGNPVAVLLDKPGAWYLESLALVGLVAALLVVVGFKVFARFEGRFAEEL